MTISHAGVARGDRLTAMRAALVAYWVEIVLAAIVAGGLALRLATLADKSLWIDETFSIGMATQSWGSFAHTLAVVQPNMELFYLLLKIAAFVTPAAWQHGAFFWRLLPALAGTGTIVAVFALARRLFGVPVALVAALLLAVNEFMVEYSQQARGYTLFVLLFTLSWLALARWIEGERRALWWFAALAALGFLTQAFEVVFVTAQIAWVALVALRGRRVAWGRFALALAPLGVVVLARYPLYAAHADQVAWILRPHVSDLVVGLRQLIGADGGTTGANYGNFVLLLFIAACLGAIGWALAPAARRLVAAGQSGAPARWLAALRRQPAVPEARRIDPIEAVALIVLWFWVPVLGTWVGSQAKPLWVTRYLAPASAAACVIFAVAVCAVGALVRGADQRAVVGGALAAIVLVALVLPLSDYLARPGWEDWRGAAAFVNARFHPGDGVVCYDNQWGCDFGFSHYFATLGGPARLDPNAPGAFSWQTYSQANREAIFARAVNPAYLGPYLAEHGRVWVLLGHFSNGQGNWGSAIAWLRAHATLVSQTVAAGDIRVYLFAVGRNQTP